MSRTALSLELVLKFLDCAKRTTEEKAKAEIGLDAKQAYYKYAKELADVRTMLRKNYYAFCDWCELGTYEAPEVKTFPTCDKCGQIKY